MPIQTILLNLLLQSLSVKTSEPQAPVQDTQAQAWATYASKRRAGLLHPPSVAHRDERDVRRQALVAAGGWP